MTIIKGLKSRIAWGNVTGEVDQFPNSEDKSKGLENDAERKGNKKAAKIIIF